MMRTAVLLSTFAIAGMASAQIFQSGFENWTGTTPDGWMGSKSSIAATSVTQVTDNVHGGSYAVRLANTSSSHVRFTTQPLTVTSGQNYEISFWVRGSGQIRVGLYDGRAGNGYAGYTPYTAATSDWQLVTQTIQAAYDTTGAQFILSVMSTAAPEHLVVDDVNIGNAAPMAPTSIYDIQFTSDASGDSPLNGQVVLTSGIVTGTYITYTNVEPPVPQYRYTYIQDGSGPWNGIVIFDYYNNNNSSAIGDSVVVTATVDEFNNLTELSGIQSFEVVASGLAGPAPQVVATGDVALEALESVLVQVQQATCTVVPSGATFGKWNVDDGTGDAVVGKVMYTVTPEPELGQMFNVTGVVSYTNYENVPEYNIQPRMASDVTGTSGIVDAGVLNTIRFGPNPATNLLQVNLGQAAGSSVEYVLADLQGRAVQTGTFSGSQGTVQVSEMATGLYHLTLRSNKLVKSVAVQVAH